MASLHFILWQSTNSVPDQHLAIYSHILPDTEGKVGAALVHWVLPQQQRRRLGRQSHSLLVEATDLLPAGQVLDAGECTLVRGTLPLANGQERLQFYFEGSSLRGHYSLLRLQVSSTRWLFGPVQYMPDRFARGAMAPLWPTTQTKLA